MIRSEHNKAKQKIMKKNIQAARRQNRRFEDPAIAQEKMQRTKRLIQNGVLLERILKTKLDTPEKRLDLYDLLTENKGKGSIADYLISKLKEMDE